MNKDHSREFSFIHSMAETISVPEGILGIGDDAAALGVDILKERKLTVTMDSMAEGYHFRKDWCSGRDVAIKLIEMNASDILVKGGIPAYAFLGVQIPPAEIQSPFIMQFQKEFLRHLARHRILLLGGDTTASSAIHFTLTMLGTSDGFIPRKGKNILPGDVVYIMGKPGLSGYGLELLQSGEKNPDIPRRAHCRPHAQWRFSRISSDEGISASVDQSDSLRETLSILADENSIQMEIDLSAIPSFATFLRMPEEKKISFLLNGGEDFATVFLVSQEKISVAWEKKISSVGGYPVGRIVSTGSSGVTYFWKDRILDANQYGDYYIHF